MKDSRHQSDPHGKWGIRQHPQEQPQFLLQHFCFYVVSRLLPYLTTKMLTLFVSKSPLEFSPYAHLAVTFISALSAVNKYHLYLFHSIFLSKLIHGL